MIDHRCVPPGWVERFVRLRCLDHDLGHQAVCILPLGFQARSPVRPTEVSERGEQAGADGVVMLGDRAELPVVPAEALDERHKLAEVIHVGDDLHKRLHKAITLRIHRHGKELARLRVPQEQIGIEKQRHLVAMHRDLGEAVFKTLSIHASLPG